MRLIVHHSLINLLLRVKDERSVLDNFLVEREAGDED